MWYRIVRLAPFPFGGSLKITSFGPISERITSQQIGIR